MDGQVSGLTALDPRVAATEQFIQKNKIPPEQVPQFLLSMGADPRLAGLVMKYQRLKKETGAEPKGPPPTSTVAQDIDAQLQGPMPNMAPPVPPMQQGLGGMPAPVMDKAQFAGGGIVAFAGGSEGPVSSGDQDELEEALRIPAAQRTPRQNELIRREGTRQFVSESMYNTPGLPVTGVGRTELPAENIIRRDPPAQKRRSNPTDTVTKSTPAVSENKPGFGTDVSGNVSLLENMQRQAGIGTAATEQEQAIKAKKDEDEKQSKSDKWLGVAQAGFKIMQAASRPGATFAGSVGEGGVDLTTTIRDINKEMRQNQREAQQQLYQIQLGREQMKAGNIEKGATLAESAQKRLDELNVAQERLKVQREEIASNEYIARLRAAEGKTKEPYMSALEADLVAARKANDSERVRKILAEMRTYKEAATAAGIAADAARERAEKALIAKDPVLQRIQSTLQYTTDPQRRAELQQQKDERIEFLSSGQGSSNPATSRTPPVTRVTSSGTPYSIIE